MTETNDFREPPLGQAMGILVSIVLCCVVVGTLSYSLGWNRSLDAVQVLPYEKKLISAEVSACRSLTTSERRNCLRTRLRHAGEAARADLDLAAQQQMAMWAMWVFVVSTLTTGATVWALWYVRGTFQATRGALYETSRTTEAMIDSNRIAAEAQRAWIDIAPAWEMIAPGANRLTYRAEAVFRNAGKSVATNVSMTMRFLTGNGASIMMQLNEMQRESMKGGGFTLMPEQTFRHHSQGTVQRGDIEWDKDGRAAFAIITVATYNIAGDQRRRSSRAIWYLRKRGSHWPGAFGVTWDDVQNHDLEVDPTSVFRCV